MLSALLVVIALASASPSPATPGGRPEPEPRQVTDPDWDQVPSPDDLSEAFPEAAMMEGLEGEVRLRCSVDQIGQLYGCRVASETPAGYGFGDAALSLADRFRMRPRIEDGRAVPGAVVQIPVAFVLPPGVLMFRADQVATCHAFASAGLDSRSPDADLPVMAAVMARLIAIKATQQGEPAGWAAAREAEGRRRLAAMPAAERAALPDRCGRMIKRIKAAQALR